MAPKSTQNPLGQGQSSALAPTQPSTTSNNSSISQSELNSIISACTQNFRHDGRSNLNYRPYTILTTKQHATPILSNGSARVFLPGSSTDVICSIKAELVHPSSHQMNQGLVELNVDTLPFASMNDDRRDIRREEMEVSSTLLHLLIPHLVDKEKLVVMKGKYVWRLNIDVLVMHCDGNLMDVCSMAIWGAMQNVRLPNVTPVVSTFGDQAKDSATTTGGGSKGGKKAMDEIMLDGDIAKSVVPVGVTDCPIVVTVCMLQKYDSSNIEKSDVTSMAMTRKAQKNQNSIMIVDARRQEEACATTKVSVSVDPKGNICGVHKYGSSSALSSESGGGGLIYSSLPQILNVAVSTSQKVFEIMESSANKSNEFINEEFGESMGAYSSFFRGHFELR